MPKAKSKSGGSGNGLEGVSTEKLKEGLAAFQRQFEMMLPNIQRALNLEDHEWEHLQRIAGENVTPAGLVRKALRFLGLLPEKEWQDEEELLIIARHPDDIISELVILRDEKARLNGLN